MNFAEKLAFAIKKNNSLLCVGLDPDLDKLPESIKQSTEPLFEFNRAIIDATAEAVCSFKPNSAFYEAGGEKAIAQLQKTCDYIREKYPDIVIILDFKRGDIGNTNAYYANFAFDELGVDAITIHPYMGRDANEPYLARKDKGIFVLCRTSNPGAGEFQDLEVDGKKLYEVVAKQVATEWNKNANCHLVVGATYPKELAEIRAIVGDDVTFLTPGIGAQGGDVKQAMQAGKNSRGEGLVFNTSRAVLYASSGANFAETAHAKATELKDEINKHR
jgi:orotidine-5'-phosphate decarboxylase